MENRSAFLKNFTVHNQNITFYCEPFWKFVFQEGRDNYLLRFTHSLLTLQISLMFLFTTTFYVLLRPFKQPFFVPQVLGGLSLGASLLAHHVGFRKKIFTVKGLMVLDLYEYIGFILFIFLVSMRIDISLVKKTGGLAFIIGLGSFVVPMIITTSSAFILRQIFSLDVDFYHSLPVIANLESTTSFHVIATVLTDLKLLNSELGRLALSSSLIAGLCSMMYTFAAFNTRRATQVNNKNALLLATLCKVVLIVVVVFIFRPTVVWMMRKTPEGKPLKESYVCTIALMILGSSLFGEFTGNHFLIGPMVFGLATPDTPPVGSSLSDKIGVFVSAVLMPCWIINIGRKVDVFQIDLTSFLVVQIINLISVLAKLLVIIIPSLYYKMSFMDAFSLGFILNCQGIFDLQMFDRAREFRLINNTSFGIMVITALFRASIFSPLVGALYDPSRKFLSYKTRSIEQCKDNSELRILACIHEQEDVPAMVGILEASNPTTTSPIAVYVLNLEALVGRSMPLLITHHSKTKPSSKYRKANRIVNAFHQFELQKQDTVCVRCFTAIAPYSTMHEEVCSLALEKDTSLIIMPFQTSDGGARRKVNRNVLEKAPCSVGILYEPAFTCSVIRTVCVIFVGGPDDREALAYGVRMAEHPNIMLTVLHLHVVGYGNEDLLESQKDVRLIDEFRINSYDENRMEYREKGVREGAETARTLTTMETEFDIILVGRRHRSDSPVLSGLSAWSEIDELGEIGDLLVSSDFKSKASVLVVQQQASVVNGLMLKESTRDVPSQLDRITSTSSLVRN